MRVAGRMHVPLRPVDARGHFDQACERGCFKVSWTAHLDIGIAGLRKKQRRPPDFELGSSAHQQVGSSRTCDQARTRLDAVRILERRGRTRYRDAVSAELARERGPLGFAGEHVERSQSGLCRQQEERGKQRGEMFHGLLLRTCRAPCGPRLKMSCRKI